MLGGDRCLSLGVSLSFPLVFSKSDALGIRGQAFWNGGKIWNPERGNNWVNDLKKALQSSVQSYGVGVLIPFGRMGRLELNYCISRKRFGFLFCVNCFFC